MNNIQNIYFSIEIWGALFSLIAALTILLTRHFVSFLTLPLIGIVIKLFKPETPFVTIAIVISVIILFVSYEASYVQFLVEKEKKLSEEKLKLVNQQMKPHFIFNTLTLIRYQCLTEPQKAAETVSEFSGYLRSITDYLTEEDCISVEAELDIVKNYLQIQSKRFGDGINCEYDIQETDFDVPPFSVQTLVENAVQHGFKSGQKKNGVIRITTKKDGKNRLVVVEDNGAGFDTKKLKKKDKGSVGITNTQNRVEIMCGGELKIESEPGKGTKAVIIIPE
ncbi:sensor histidine kinase [Ruminococcus sp. JL13D9]|uniref:sensor histidine kinase n=1 Tax=Ruminococcus sp. JL13D9 TaxID=3233381 RepID=UPI003899A233